MYIKCVCVCLGNEPIPMERRESLAGLRRFLEGRTRTVYRVRFRWKERESRNRYGSII